MRCPVVRLGRRAFLQDASMGFGTLALAYLLDQERGAARAESPGRSERMDLRRRPGHFPARARSVIMLMQVGGPEPDRSLRPQARAAKARRPGAQPGLRDASARQRKQEADGQPVPVPPPRRVRDGALGIDPRDRLGRGRRVPGPLDVQRQQQPPPGHALPALAARSFRAGRRSARGSAMPSAPRTRTCRPTSCCAIPTATTTAARRCGRAAGCRPSTRGPRSSRAARPSSTFIPPSNLPTAPSATTSMRWRG